MFNWLHHLLNPHCPHCLQIERERHELQRAQKQEEYERFHDEQICHSCENLKIQLALVNDEKNRLLDRLLEKPEPIEQAEPVKMTRPNRPMPWAARRQLLEQEDKKKAQLMREVPKSVEELEKELDVEEKSNV